MRHDPPSALLPAVHAYMRFQLCRIIESACSGPEVGLRPSNPTSSTALSRGLASRTRTLWCKVGARPLGAGSGARQADALDRLRGDPLVFLPAGEVTIRIARMRARARGR
jgi:hypothetical protein